MRNQGDEGEFQYHEPCENCGSSDAKAVYTNGSAYCFSCETWYPSKDRDPQRRSKPVPKDLLTEIKFSSLKTRKITEETCRKFGYGYGQTAGGNIYQVAPYRDPEGDLVAQHLRTKDKDFSWRGEAKNLQLFGQHLWKGGKRLVITEGEIDCLTISQAFNNNWATVSVPNGAQSAKKYIKQNLEFIEGFEEVVIAFDNDDQGKKAVNECAPLIKVGKVKVANFTPYKDANHMLQKGKNADIAPVVFNAKEYRPDGILASSEISMEYLLSEEDVEGFEIPYPLLNTMIKTLRKGELTTLTAGTGAGKSTFAREVAFHLAMEHDLKVGHIALEESIKKSSLGFIAIDLDVPMGDLFLNKSIVTEEQFATSYEKVMSKDNFLFYDHFGSLEAESLMAKIRYLANGLDVDFIVLDHISIVVSGITDGDERRTIDNLMTNLRSIVEHSGVGMILISHLRVPQGKQTAHEEGGRVTLNQLRGSGSIKQLSDNIIAVERDQQADEPDISNIRILKSRLFGTTGLADICRYNKVTGRLQATDEFDEHLKELEEDDNNDNKFTTTGDF